MDHGIDWPGDDEQHEELNHIVEGAKYGRPYVYAHGKPNPQGHPPAGISVEEWTAQSAEPVGLYVPHATPTQMTFHTGQAFPEEYRSDDFVAMRGAWNRRPPSGYEVVRIDFEDGRPVGFEPFVTGFRMEDAASPSGWSHMSRLAVFAQGPDGALYLSDDVNRVAYRITYSGQGAAAGEGAPALTNAEEAAVRVSGAETPPRWEAEAAPAMQVLGAQADRVDVISPAYGDGEPIPSLRAAEEENVSPALDWAEGPGGKRSFVLMVEDPDAVEEPAFARWLAYDIPADVTELREGVPGTPQLPLPEGMKQGRNDYGSTCRRGLNPPPGDPAHRYRFQTYAFDTTLELPHEAGRAKLIEAMI